MPLIFQKIRHHHHLVYPVVLVAGLVKQMVLVKLRRVLVATPSVVVVHFGLDALRVFKLVSHLFWQ